MPSAEISIEGYASLFHESDLIGDCIQPGAFRRSLAEQAARGGVAMLLQHDANAQAGRWTRISEDARGLRVEGRISLQTLAGRIAARLIESGELGGLSIGFFARHAAREGPGRRILCDIDLREISLVSAPLAPGARFFVTPTPSRQHRRYR